MIKNIIFDMGNVVVRWDPEYILKHFTKELEEIQILKQVIFESPEWLMLDQGILTEKEVAEKLSSNLSCESLKKLCTEILEHGLEHLPVYAEMEELIRDLKEKGYAIYALSNTSDKFYQWIQKQTVWQYFDGAVLSYQEKVSKPNQAIYEILLKRYQLKPEECFFVDDRPENIEAAKSLGINGHVFAIENFQELIKILKEGRNP